MINQAQWLIRLDFTAVDGGEACPEPFKARRGVPRVLTPIGMSEFGAVSPLVRITQVVPIVNPKQGRVLDTPLGLGSSGSESRKAGKSACWPRVDQTVIEADSRSQGLDSGE